jgi:hypothetical protein
MNKNKLLSFIKHSRILLSEANNEQKIRIMNALRESIKKYQNSNQQKPDLDYLDEK